MRQVAPSFACMCACMCAREHACAHVCAYLHARAYVTCPHVCARMGVNVCMSMRLGACTSGSSAQGLGVAIVGLSVLGVLGSRLQL